MEINKTSMWLLSLVMLCVWQGCKDSKFRTTGENVKGGVRDVQGTCTDKGRAPNVTQDITGLAGTEVKLVGEFCAITLDTKAKEAATVLFIVDVSGSMADSDPNPTSCGRLQAANALVSKIEQQVANPLSGTVRVGLIQFGSQAEVKFQPEDVKTVRPKINPANFCFYYDTSLSQNRQKAGTNYEDAFASAASMLSTQSGKKYIVFITDGEPTVYGRSKLGNVLSANDPSLPIMKGQAAADELRAQQGGNLVMHAVFLQSTPQTPGFDPNAYLNQIVASASNPANRVAVVSNTQELLVQVQAFEPPKPAIVQGNSMLASISADGFGTRPIDLEPLQLDPARPGYYRFVTKPIPLFGKNGAVTVNTVKISAQASDQVNTEAIYTIRFDQRAE